MSFWVFAGVCDVVTQSEVTVSYFMCYDNPGSSYEALGRLGGAVLTFRSATDGKPGAYQGTPPIWLNLDDV